jgi:putative ABC transport system permease protein
MLLESIKMSWRNIRKNKVRSFLTMLGIIIGVTAIISLMTIVQGVIDEFDDQFYALGVNKVMVQASGTPLKSGLTAQDLKAIAALDNISGVSPTVNVTMDVHIDGVLREDVSLEGKNEVYFQMEPGAVKRGRGINYLDTQNRNRVCLISVSLEQKLMPGQDAMGRFIAVDGINYTIIGIVGNSNSVQAMMQGDKDTVIIPYTNALQLGKSENIRAVDVYLTNSDLTDQTIRELKGVLTRAFNYREDSYNVINMKSMLDTMKTMQNMMQVMLVGIASIALLVGGIGIMNMMLVTVTERTTEIGLRKALGARPKQIQTQFLLEAVFLSLMGGAIGVVLGVGISILAAMAIGTDFSLSLQAVFLGFGFSAIVGVVFGLAPAKKASELNPIDALRSA